MPSPRDVSVLVIGAGPTGIGAAVRLSELGEDHLLVDAGDRVGGMAASHTDGHGFTWDLGGHVIHSHFPEFDAAVHRSGVEIGGVVRNGWAWLRGDDADSMVPAPVQAQLEELPTDLRQDAEASHLADYYRNMFGTHLYDTFFSGYNEKMWTLPLEQVDHTWTSLRSGGSGRNVPRLGLARDYQRPHETFPYPRGGTGALWAGIAGALAQPERMRLGTRVTALDVPRRTATLDDGSQVRYEHLVSTAPMTWTMRQAGMAAETETLHASSEIAVGLGYRGEVPERLRDVTWLYCPDRSVAWSRGTVMSTYDPEAAGEGRWSMLLEVPHMGGARVAAEDAVRACRRSLVELGADDSALESAWTFEIPMAYPVPTLGRDAILRRADAELIAHGVRSRGRFGGWRYESCNQDYSYMQGRQAVDAALTGGAEDVLWEPEKF